MIEKERLEELIEQGATIYEAKYNDVVPVSLTNEINCISWRYGVIAFKPMRKHKWLNHKYFKNLFETEDEAREHLEFGNITRTERLELPSWDIIENIIEQKKRFGLNHSDKILARIITKDSIYYFKICKDLDLFTFELKQTYIGEDLCEQLSTKFPISLGKATKANYDKARRLCVKLFKGEEV